MPGLNLPSLARANGIRSAKTLRPIITTQAQASELAAIILQVVKVWEAAVPSIMAQYDPTPLTDALTIDTIPGMQSAIDDADATVSRLMVLINTRLREWSVRLEKWHRSKWISSVAAATAIDLSTVLTGQPVVESLSSWLFRNVALVQNVSDQTRSRISDAVFRGYQQRLPPRDVGKEISETLGMARTRANNIAADQSKKLAGALDVERQAEAGITMFRYRHGGKLHARPWHRARDGKIYVLKAGKQVDGPDKIEPGDGPTEPPFCSCIRQAYIPLLDEFGL